MWTVLEVLREASGYLEKRGVESARLNAELLLAHVLGVGRMGLYLEFDRPLGEAERGPFRELVRERGRRRPLQHLVGSVEFCGREFLCDARALIPRPETEEFVGHILERTGPAAMDALDAGTGSGVIAVSLALARTAWRLAATDSSPGALALARENAARLAAPVSFHEADLFPPDGPPYGLIAANLPYIPADEIPGLEPEVRHDPVEALDGGPDGMAATGRLVARAPGFLARGGLLALETGSGQHELLAPRLEEHAFHDIEPVRDYQGAFRFLFARYG
jgi:release factor glutamine methyltransferase